jgi:hypothetical protein
MGHVARRLLAGVTALMPRGRRDWGMAMIAELEHVGSRRDQARLVLGAIRVALLPPPWLARYGRPAGHACGVALVAAVPLAIGLYLSNVVFPSPEDNGFGVLAMDLYVIIALMTAGAAARRAGGGTGQWIVAGMLAGLVIAVLGMGTFAVIDNVFLNVVMHQRGKIDGFRASGLTSMRAYINGDLEATAPGVAILLASGGAFLGSLGAVADGELSFARARRRALPRRDRL